ncbi:MAG: redox-sensitive transcriptional activator SoxR [Sphingomonadaceae bacterium]|nr:redox-sensitive transcriptional activator SoxR [Sphingomonadaceae bacterium]
MAHAHDLLTIGTIAARSGISVSAVRYYEARGLIAALRTSGGQRRYMRGDLRRIAFILIAQRLGLSLDDIAAELANLPQNRTPNRADWAAAAARMAATIDRQIAHLVQMRENLGGCIGCGCLSLDRCALYNAGDKAAARGAGPRYTMGDRPAAKPAD